MRGIDGAAGMGAMGCAAGMGWIKGCAAGGIGAITGLDGMGCGIAAIGSGGVSDTSSSP